MNKELIEQLKRDEGFRQYAYADTEGVMSIGYGYNLVANPLKLSLEHLKKMRNDGISEQSAEDILIICANNAEHECEQNFPWWGKLSINRQCVLINMCYNMGIKKLLKFKITLSLIEKGDYTEASKQMLKSKWAKQVGNRALRLSEKMRT